jgi:hypothetical protein
MTRKRHESVMSVVMNGKRLHIEKIMSIPKVTEVWLSITLYVALLRQRYANMIERKASPSMYE